MDEKIIQARNILGAIGGGSGQKSHEEANKTACNILNEAIAEQKIDEKIRKIVKEEIERIYS